jgi:preprotein translocase subunit SecF
VSAERPNVALRLFRGETSFDFAGRWRRWFAISGLVILAGLISLGVRGLNFSIEFKGGTSWEVPTQTASLSDARNAIGSVSAALRQANVTILQNKQTHQREIEVQAAAKDTANDTEITQVSSALATMAGVPSNQVTINDVGPSWGADITNKAIRAVIIFLVLCSLYIWLRFEAKMAIGALCALLHDIVLTAGIYSLSGFQVSPDTVIAFLTILGYSLYDTIVVFDKVQENTKGLASTGRLTYTDTVNLSMNQVLARSLNTSFVAILPILSILIIGSGFLHATALNDFGLALLVGLTTGAYSSIFIASPIVALLKEREPRYAQIRERLAARQSVGRRITPASAAGGTLPSRFDDTPPPVEPRARRPGSAPRRPAKSSGASPLTPDRPPATTTDARATPTGVRATPTGVRATPTDATATSDVAPTGDEGTTTPVAAPTPQAAPGPVGIGAITPSGRTPPPPRPRKKRRR